jgi:AcrR family transcriptional regulator
MTVRRNRRGEAKRAELIAIGKTVFGAQRYDDVAIEDVAQRAGVAAGLINYHFGSKRGFYLTVLQAGVTEFWANLHALRGLPTRERLQRGVDAFIDYAQHNPAAFESFLVNVPDAEVRELHRRELDAMTDAMALEITGSPSTPLLRSALAGWLFFVEGMLLHWITTGRSTPREHLRELATQNLIATVRAAMAVDAGIVLSHRAQLFTSARLATEETR